MTVRRINPALIAALIVLPLLTILQQGITPHFTLFGARPDFVLLAVVDWGLIRGVEEGMLWGFVGGIFVDLFSGLPFGTSSLAYVSIAGIVSLGENVLLRTHILLPLVSGAIATVLYYAIAIVVVASTRHVVLFDDTVLHTIIGVALYNAVINPIIYVGAQLLDTRLHPVARASW
jgi:rod shape-determining protein MreD